MTAPVNCAYLDCFSGISGDMLLGALIDCGVPAELLRKELDKIDCGAYELDISKKKINSISATSVTVTPSSDAAFRNLTDITAILERSSLEPAVIHSSLAVFKRLAEAEAKVHGKAVQEIHFHEVGAVDTIIDIVGSVIALKFLGVRSVHCSPLPLGRGFVRCAHGTLPLPAPAVCTLLENIPVYGIEADQELVTPTGAALVAVLADSFGTFPSMLCKSTGYGAGDREGSENQPNVLRVITGRKQDVEEAQEVEIIETHLDDWSPEGFPYLSGLLFKNRALDVSLTPIHMKKGRPGFCLSVICNPADAYSIKTIILSETTAIGLRFRHEQRMTLPREIIEIATPWGKIAAKKVETPAGTTIYPEYEACRVVAENHSLPLNKVYLEVHRLAKEDD
jgi:uncharacterized protein (TIGR00299 family) protein